MLSSGSIHTSSYISVLLHLTIHIGISCAYVNAKSLQLCRTLCNPMDCSLPGSSVHGILQARLLEWVAKPFSRGSSHPGIEPASLMSPALAGWFFTASTTWEA